ncbi:MAG: type II toxin-antitoxin system RelE/ParE family toxin [Pleurocapsa sp.]
MSYAIFVFRGAQKTLAKLPKQDYQRVRAAIEDLAQTSRPRGCKKLTGRPAWRIRVGVYRIIYEINDRQQTITIVDIGHRRDIYRSN